MKTGTAALSLLLAWTLGISPALAVQEDIAETTNTAPVAENQQLETYRGVSVGGQLAAYDAEGDALTFELTTEPMKGSVDLRPDGCFVYSPRENKRGKDYFGFRAVDSQGAASQEGTVIIRLLRQKTAVTYADMTGDAAAYAAVVLTEQGVFTGQSVGADTLFVPETPLTRGEFLTMCMTAAGREPLRAVSSTGFRDDDAIAPWLKPYVATALMNGYITGSPADGGAVFRPNDPVTLREACIMLNAVLGVTDVLSAAYLDDAEIDGAQAVANLTAAHVMLPVWDDLDAPVTRAQAAQLLLGAIELISRR